MFPSSPPGFKSQPNRIPEFRSHVEGISAQTLIATTPLMEEPKEELEPLFDYTRVQPTISFIFDDTDLETSDIFVHCKRRKVTTASEKVKEGEKESKKSGGEEKVVLDDGAAAVGGEKNGGEEDWLPLPPAKPVPGSELEKDKTLQELRLKKQELALFAQSAQDVLQNLVESAKKELGTKKPTELVILEQPPEQQVERQKIVISIQDKDGQQQFRIYKDDKFEKLFKAYAKKAKLNPENLVFSFDGDKVSPARTPEDLSLEDDDMIEVHQKSC